MAAWRLAASCLVVAAAALALLLPWAHLGAEPSAAYAWGAPGAAAGSGLWPTAGLEGAGAFALAWGSVAFAAGVLLSVAAAGAGIARPGRPMVRAWLFGAAAAAGLAGSLAVRLGLDHAPELLAADGTPMAFAPTAAYGFLAAFTWLALTVGAACLEARDALRNPAAPGPASRADAEPDA